MDLEDCFRKGLIKKTKVNDELIQSLLEVSNIKENAVNNADVNEENITAYVSLAYDSLREVLEAICILKGYKVLSHICIGELLKKELELFEYEEYDRLRWIRNGINYYGRKVEFNQGEEIINKIFSIKLELLKTYLE